MNNNEQKSKDYQAWLRMQARLTGANVPAPLTLQQAKDNASYERFKAKLAQDRRERDGRLLLKAAERLTAKAEGYKAEGGYNE